LELLDRADAQARDSGERWYEAEVHRLRGELLAARDPRRAEASLQAAIDIARAQDAKLWELRATVSLATLWRDGRKKDAARRLLEPVLSSFAKEPDAPELRAARAVQSALA
jgi:predicted ATPase